jgi:hypothetical protein
MTALIRILTTVAAIAVIQVCSCDKISGAMKQVEGKVAGQVLNSSGHGRGYVTIELKPEGGGDPYIGITEEAGNFLIENVTPGTYTLHVKMSGEDSNEIPSDTPTIKLGPGRTLTQNVILTDQPAK